MKKLNYKYCEECKKGKLHWDTFCFTCYPEKIKDYYKKTNLAVLICLAVYFFIASLLLCLLTIYAPNFIMNYFRFGYNPNSSIQVLSLLIAMPIIVFIGLFINYLIPLIVRFIIYKKPKDNFKVRLLASINALLLLFFNIFTNNIKIVSNSTNNNNFYQFLCSILITIAISRLIMTHGYDERLEEIENNS